MKWYLRLIRTFPEALFVWVLSIFSHYMHLRKKSEYSLKMGQHLNTSLFFLFVLQSTSNSSVLCVGVFSHSLVSMGFSMARMLKWVAISYSRGSFQPRDPTHVSCISCAGRRILYHCSTWEANTFVLFHQNRK